MAAKPKYTLEIATNAPVGIWKVFDRTFWDRRLTIGERTRAWAHQADIPILAAALTCLKVEGEEIQEDWIIENLSTEDVNLAFAFLNGGQEGVSRYLAGPAPAQADG